MLVVSLTKKLFASLNSSFPNSFSQALKKTLEAEVTVTPTPTPRAELMVLPQAGLAMGPQGVEVTICRGKWGIFVGKIGDCGGF